MDVVIDSTIRQSLAEAWEGYDLPSHVTADDLTIAINLFAKLAEEACSLPQSDSLVKKHKIAQEAETATDTVGRIKSWVTEKALPFLRICNFGLPFSLLENHSAELALRRSLKHPSRFLYHLLTPEDRWLLSEELSQRFQNLLEQVPSTEIAKTCYYLREDYLKNKKYRAGYYLLWLIKQTAGCDYQLPKPSTFDDKTVAQVLTVVCLQAIKCQKPTILIEILHFRSSLCDNMLCQDFLEGASLAVYLQLTMRCLRDIAMDAWPQKGDLILKVLKTMRDKAEVASTLAASPDPNTASLGQTVIAAFAAPSFRQAIPHFNTLCACLPNCDRWDIQRIFDYPFPEFIYKNVPQTNDEYCKQLRFPYRHQAFAYPPLIIGVHRYEPDDGRQKLYLLAYHTESEKMVWGFPLMSKTPISYGEPGYAIIQGEDFLGLRYVGENKLHFINPQTGECSTTIDTPYVLNNSFDRLHIGCQGYAYQMKAGSPRVVTGGKIVNDQWITSFEFPTPTGLFHAFETHCGFKWGNRLTLVGPTGDSIIIESCLHALASRGQFYSIEKELGSKNCVLNIRTLKIDQHVISPIEQRIPLLGSSMRIAAVCENNQLILINDHELVKRYILFVDLKTGSVLNSPHTYPSFGSQFINARTGKIWTWDPVEKSVWKISSSHMTRVGSLDSAEKTTLVYVDERDNLYYTY